MANMRKEDTLDVLNSAMAVVFDALAVFGGFAIAAWVRFDSGWFAAPRGRPPNLYTLYLGGAAFAALLFMLVFRWLQLFSRPFREPSCSKPGGLSQRLFFW